MALLKSHLEFLIHLSQVVELGSEVLDLKASVFELYLGFLVCDLKVFHLAKLDLHFLHDLSEAWKLLHQGLGLRNLEI